jgi:7-cyano-7-deazaguanine reductase
MSEKLSILGKTIREPISSDQLETVPCPEGVKKVILSTNEMTAFCPVTSQPDFYHLEIEYVAVGKIVETKSLKLYLWGWREKRVMAEPLAAQIATDLAKIVETSVTVTITQQPRGGIVLKAQAIGLPSK